MQVPVYVARDVNKRLHDWFEAGGLENSHYVRTQINFLKMIGAAKELCVQAASHELEFPDKFFDYVYSQSLRIAHTVLETLEVNEADTKFSRFVRLYNVPTEYFNRLSKKFKRNTAGCVFRMIEDSLLYILEKYGLSLSIKRMDWSVFPKQAVEEDLSIYIDFYTYKI